MMKKIRNLLMACALLAAMPVLVSAETVTSGEHLKPRLVDEADLLTSSEEEALLAKLDEISKRQQFDVAVVTVNSLGGKSPETFADDYYDDNGYGMGEDDDGALLLISMEERDWYITTHGYGITAITDAGLEYLGDQVVPCLSEGDYEAAFTMYADLCDDFVTQAKNDAPYDVGHLPREKRGAVTVILSIVTGFVLAFIPMLIMIKKMKNVQKQETAGDYVESESIAVTERRDRFLYDTVTRTPIPKSSSGGSSTHRSSSGRSHGGGGGKF